MLALVDSVRLRPGEARVQVDAVLLLPGDSVQASSKDIGFASRQPQTESLEILPLELTNGEFRGGGDNGGLMNEFGGRSIQPGMASIRVSVLLDTEEDMPTS